MRSQPVITSSKTLCGECDSDIPTGCAVIERTMPMVLERRRFVALDDVRAGQFVTTNQVREVVTKELVMGLETICLDCATPAEKSLIGAVFIVSPTYVEPVDATPINILGEGRVAGSHSLTQ